MELPKRKSIRLKDYDYSKNGAYFVTICTHNRENILGYVCRDDPCGHPMVKLNQLGKIAKTHIETIEKRYGIKIDKYVVMPNHIHFILMIQGLHGNGHPQGVSLQQIIGGYKSYVSTAYLKICKINHIFMGEIWQKSYHDHIIRNEQEYQKIWKYIDTNALKYQLDCYYTK